MENELIIREGDLEDINTIGFIAQQVWPVAYREILTPEQLRYMLKLFYSPEALKKQMITDHHHFLIAELEEEPVGFASFSQLDESGIYKLHKLYVNTTLQSKGVGKALLESVLEEVKQREGTELHLNVNRNNKALGFYKKSGFTVLRE
ncbi:MAG: GNAT family N-acetyltransferase, partial [Flavitalea sp.]